MTVEGFIHAALVVWPIGAMVIVSAASVAYGLRHPHDRDEDMISEAVLAAAFWPVIVVAWSVLAVLGALPWLAFKLADRWRKRESP